MAKYGIVAAVLGLSLGLGYGAQAADSTAGDADAGLRYASETCAECHDVRSRRNDERAKVDPPSFHAIANARTTSAMGLNVFLVSPHRNMPNLIIAERDRRNVIAYILSLRETKRPAPS